MRTHLLDEERKRDDVSIGKKRKKKKKFQEPTSTFLQERRTRQLPAVSSPRS